jgi:GDP-fucose transporter C1
MAQEEHSRLAVVSAAARRQWPSTHLQLGTVGFYMVVAISMTLLNKSETSCGLAANGAADVLDVLSSTPLPVFLLLCQSAVAVVLLALENKLGPAKTPKCVSVSQRICRHDTRTADSRFDRRIAWDLVPLVGVNITGLV